MNSAESRAQEIGGGQGAQGGISVAELQDAAKAAAAARVKQPYSGYSSEEEEELSLEEQQAMEMENERLVEQLSSLTSQVIYLNRLIVLQEGFFLMEPFHFCPSGGAGAE